MLPSVVEHLVVIASCFLCIPVSLQQISENLVHVRVDALLVFCEQIYLTHCNTASL